MKKTNLAYFYIAAAGILWGMLSLFVKYLSAAGFSSMEIVEIRSLFSVILLIVICLIKNPKLLKIRLRDIPLFLGTGIVSIILFNTCYFSTIKMSGASTAALLLYTAPAMVMVISVFVLKEKLTANKILALVMTMLGLLFVSGIFSSGEHLSGKALLVGLGSGFGYAMYSIFGKFLARKYESLTITTYTFLVAALGLLPFIKVTHVLECLENGGALGAGIGITVVCTVIPYLCYTAGLRKVDAGLASIVATVEPLVATAIGVLVYREALTPGKIAGIVFICMAIVVLNLKTNRWDKVIQEHTCESGE